MKLRDKLKLALLAKRIADALPDIELMKEKLTSRKFWATIAAVTLTAFGDQLGASPEATKMIVSVIAAYIGGQAIVDAAAAFKAK